MILAFALSCSLATQEVALDTVEADRVALLRGVDALAAPGTPGWAVPFGAGAFSVLTAGDEALPVISAARVESGRVLALAHGGWLAGDPLEGELGGTRSLLENALSWCAGGELPSSIVVWGGSASFQSSLQAFTSGSVTSEERIEPGSLVIWSEAYMPSGRSEALLVEHVRAGGGLLCAVCPWGWAQVNARRGLDLRQGLPWNRVLAPLGLAFTDGTASGRGGRFAVADSDPGAAHAASAERSDLAVAVVRALPPELLAHWGELAARLEGSEVQRGARPGAPLTSEASDARLWVVSETHAWRERAPEEVGMAPGAEEFPGAVLAGGPRVTRALSFSADVPGWQSTGLYLAPGEVLVVRTGIADLWRLRIGAHTDSLWHKARWQRWPRVSHSQELEAGEQRIATPFGGALYLEARAGQYGQSATPELAIEFEGAVEAPYFDATDPDSVAAWSTSRAAPAPWAELEGRHIIFSAPSAAVRKLDDPTAVLAYWDAVVEAHCELGGVELPARKERVVSDVQISAGYMHSGYPIMTGLDVVTPGRDGTPANFFDIERLERQGDWGLFHELGHNRQRPVWTFGGTGEVTCNLFSLHAMERMCSIEPWEHPWMAGALRRAPAHLAAGAPFDSWKSSPGLALVTYAQVQREFGWEPIARVLAGYEAEGRDSWPRGDQARIDGWVRRLSLACERDLRGFHSAWGWPLSAELLAEELLDELSPWGAEPLLLMRQ